MRRIAEDAGVSLGNAYYYFASKDELVHELYLQVQREHRARTLPQLVQDGASGFIGRSAAATQADGGRDLRLPDQDHRKPRPGPGPDPDPPALWVNASTGTIYRDARDRPQGEATGELGSGLSAAVAPAWAWEHELFCPGRGPQGGPATGHRARARRRGAPAPGQQSRWVFPRVLLDSGFTFAHPELAEALEQIVTTERQPARAA